MKFNSDVDIDVADRDTLLQHIQHTPAAMRAASPQRKHSSGVFVTEIAYDPYADMAVMDYAEAEHRGYIKLDLLNVYVYQWVRDEQHLIELMREPDWSMLKSRQRVLNLIHLNNHYWAMQRMPEPIDSIPRLAMFLAVIRPAKRHLLGKTWAEIAETVWDKSEDEYSFKRAHAIAYAQLVVVHMNLWSQGLAQSFESMGITNPDVLPE